MFSWFSKNRYYLAILNLVLIIGLFIFCCLTTNLTDHLIIYPKQTDIGSVDQFIDHSVLSFFGSNLTEVFLRVLLFLVVIFLIILFSVWTSGFIIVSSLMIMFFIRLVVKWITKWDILLNLPFFNINRVIPYDEKLSIFQDIINTSDKDFPETYFDKVIFPQIQDSNSLTDITNIISESVDAFDPGFFFKITHFISSVSENILGFAGDHSFFVVSAAFLAITATGLYYIYVELTKLNAALYSLIVITEVLAAKVYGLRESVLNSNDLISSLVPPANKVAKDVSENIEELNEHTVRLSELEYALTELWKIVKSLST